MQIDLIEIRAGNYFAFNNQVKQVNEYDLADIRNIHGRLFPLLITSQRLLRLNFSLAGEAQHRTYQKLCNGVFFDFHRVKENGLLLVVNNVIKLKHVLHIHQLQNIYYDLTGDVLLRPGTDQPQQPSPAHPSLKTQPGAGKYRSR